MKRTGRVDRITGERVLICLDKSGGTLVIKQTRDLGLKEWDRVVVTIEKAKHQGKRPTKDMIDDRRRSRWIVSEMRKAAREGRRTNLTELIRRSRFQVLKGGLSDEHL